MLMVVAPQSKPGHELSVREALRHTTHGHHQRLHHHPMLASMTRPELSLATYRLLLLAYLPLYKVLEERIKHFLDSHSCSFDYSARCKLPLLEKDASFFGVDLSEHEDIISKSIFMPELAHLGQLIGVLYVIEGATLGGQVISRKLKLHLDLDSSNGACFFNGYGEQSQPMWEKFMHFAESIAGVDSQRVMAERAANQTFMAFEQALTCVHGKCVENREFIHE